MSVAHRRSISEAQGKTARSIVDAVAAKHGFDPEQLLGKGRYQDVAAARHEAMFRIRTELKWSLPRIGALFHRDHSTVIYALRRHAGESARSLQRWSVRHRDQPEPAQ